MGWEGSTGIAGIPFQSQMGPKYKSACNFLCACVLAGIHDTGSIEKARNWALQNGKIRDDNYVNMSSTELGKQLASHFGTTFHSEWEIKRGTNHFYVTDHSGNEVFNSAGRGKQH